MTTPLQAPPPVRRTRPPDAATPSRPGRSVRGRVAAGLGRVVARASRMAGFDGAMIGGRLALMLYPGCLAELAAGRRVVLVSGTNGKTTTTAMLAAALRTAGPVATNTSGANMLDGLTAALDGDPADTVVGEVDELYLRHAVAQTGAAALVLLNLSRDQLDRAGELRDTARLLRELAADHPDLRVIANGDDPYVAWIAAAFDRVVWVATGRGWHGDSGSCPACGHRLDTGSDTEDNSDGATGWRCTHCPLRRPEPAWRLSAATLHGEDGGVLGVGLVAPDGDLIPVRTSVPGTVNDANAAMAVAAAETLGVPGETAARAAGAVTGAAGRYSSWRVGEHAVRLILAKNPAGWSAALQMLPGPPHPVVVAINAGEADGRDTSWLYDVDLECLAGHPVVTTGRRAADLGVRLSYAGVAHTTTADPLAALDRLPTGAVTVLADYTGFAALRRRLRAVGAHAG